MGCGIKNNIVNNNQNNIHDNVSPIESSQTAAKKAEEASLKSELDNYAKAHFTVTKEVKEISLESTDCDTKQAMTKIIILFLLILRTETFFYLIL